MPYITISHHDGEYYVRDIPEAETARMSDAADPGDDVLYVEDATLRAWRRHEDEHAAWGAHWRAISNEQHAQRRIAALRPLEVAEDRIRALEEEVARAANRARFARTAPPTNLTASLATKDGIVNVRHRRTGAVLAHGTAGLFEVIEQAAKDRLDLAWADLANRNLHDAHLADALLGDADLSDANLSFADLTDADLANAVLVRANLGCANLTDADLHDANLDAANLAHANLTNASLIGARVNSVQLIYANLTNANLGGAIIRDAILTGTDFTGANFTGADLRGAVGLVATEAQLASMAYRPYRP